MILCRSSAPDSCFHTHIHFEATCSNEQGAFCFYLEKTKSVVTIKLINKKVIARLPH